MPAGRYDTSAFGAVVQLRASKTFPQGFTVTEFAPDADPIDIPAVTQGEAQMGINGDLVVYSKAAPIALTLNVIATSESDINLNILARANRVGRGKSSARDEITAVIKYATGEIITLSKGIIISAMPGNSLASAGGTKTKVYGFMFGTA